MLLHHGYVDSNRHSGALKPATRAKIFGSVFRSTSSVQGVRLTSRLQGIRDTFLHKDAQSDSENVDDRDRGRRAPHADWMTHLMLE